jgi:hypothetical protein
MAAKIKSLFSLATIALVSVVVTSCYTEDPGPLQQMEKDYSIDDFDRLEMGDAFVIRVEQGNFFSISARGDERNIDDLEIRKEGSTLVVRFDDNHNRKHQTFIDITMPSLREANFSGSTNSIVTGFEDEDEFKISLSGASVAQVDVEAIELNITLSGASSLNLSGVGSEVSVGASGASEFKGFNFQVEDAYVNASGASSCKVNVSDKLNAVASGASSIFYRGNPAVTSNVSGGSTVQQD